MAAISSILLHVGSGHNQEGTLIKDKTANVLGAELVFLGAELFKNYPTTSYM